MKRSTFRFMAFLALFAFCLFFAQGTAATEKIPSITANGGILGNVDDYVGYNAAVGDINGDGLPDLVFGAPGA